MNNPLNIVIFGLSITSSWGNGHATTFRGLVRELAARGHDVLFLERDVPWYASNRDLPAPTSCRTELYGNIETLKQDFVDEVRKADLVIVGSYVPEGIEVGEWVTAAARGVTAFYDIDTPVTLAKLARGRSACDYLSRELIPQYQLYLSFTGGPTLERLEDEFHSPMARPLYCAVDPTLYFPEQREQKWDLGYMGTYSDDRQLALDQLLIEPARLWSDGRFVIAGPQYPANIRWPTNVERIDHLPPHAHRSFYNSQCFTLNITRSEMVRVGYSPSVRLFEAAACAIPIVSDWWSGLDEFFEIGSEILVARSADEMLLHLRNIPDSQRRAIGERARQRTLSEHTAAHRAVELEGYVREVMRAGRLQRAA